MLNYIILTLKSVIKDRIFHGIAFTILIFLLIPSVASLSMRQVTELSINLSLSLLSFVLLLLALFLGGTQLWKDIERRYTFGMLSLPRSRSFYMIGKFLGVAIFIFATACFLGLVSAAVIALTAGTYPPERPIAWDNLAVAVVFEGLKYILLVAIAFLFASVGTSFFLPVFGAICTYFIGNASQQVYDYVTAPATIGITLFSKKAATLVYYLLPNFSVFDFKVNAVYGIPISWNSLLLCLAYFIIYVLVAVVLAALLFEKREIT